MNKTKLWLARLLIVLGAGLLLATVPVFFPVSLMATIHGWLGMGEFPAEPITIYLARSTSLLYAVHGTVMITTGCYIDNMKPMVPLLGWLHIIIGLTMFGIDLTTPMPWYWTAAEGIPVSLAGILILWMWSKALHACKPIGFGDQK